MRRLKAIATSTAMTFLWAVQAFAAEPKTEKIQVALDIPPNPFFDQLCVVANYLTIGAIVCSFIFGGIWLMQKKDAVEEDEDEDDDETVVTPISSTPKQIETSPAEPARIESKTDGEAAPGGGRLRQSGDDARRAARPGGPGVCEPAGARGGRRRGVGGGGRPPPC